MWILALWLASMFVAVKIASSRGNNPGWAFFWALVLGPIGALIALVLPANPVALEREKLVTGQMKKCGVCAELIRPEALKCRYCGTNLERGGAWSDAPPDPRSQEAGSLADAIPESQRNKSHWSDRKLDP